MMNQWIYIVVPYFQTSLKPLGPTAWVTSNISGEFQSFYLDGPGVS